MCYQFTDPVTGKAVLTVPTECDTLEKTTVRLINALSNDDGCLSMLAEELGVDRSILDTATLTVSIRKKVAESDGS